MDDDEIIPVISLMFVVKAQEMKDFVNDGATEITPRIPEVDLLQWFCLSVSNIRFASE